MGCTGSARGEGSECTKKEGERAEGPVLPSDHRHEEDQEDEQEAAQVDLEDGHNGRQAQGLHQEGEEGCGDGYNKVRADGKEQVRNESRRPVRDYSLFLLSKSVK